MGTLVVKGLVKKVTLGLINNKLKCQFITIDYRIIDSYYFISVCQTKLDLCFIVDTSGSVGWYNFQRVQGFLKKLIDFFNVGRDDTHIALITYSYSVCSETAAQGYSGKKLAVFAESVLANIYLFRYNNRNTRKGVK